MMAGAITVCAIFAARRLPAASKIRTPPVTRKRTAVSKDILVRGAQKMLKSGTLPRDGSCPVVIAIK
jgi:hypothetical protein